MMNIYDEFPDYDSIMDYARIYQDAIRTAETLEAKRLMDTITLMVAAAQSPFSSAMDNYPTRVAVMLASEAIEAYEKAIGLRE